MSLLILVFLIGIGLIILGVIRSYESEHIENNISELATSLFTGYALGLFFASLACFGYGIYWWLKNGTWFTVSPFYLLTFISDDSAVKNLLLSETTWMGIQKAGDWYLFLNLGWSFIFTFVVLFMALAFTTSDA